MKYEYTSHLHDTALCLYIYIYICRRVRLQGFIFGIPDFQAFVGTFFLLSWGLVKALQHKCAKKVHFFPIWMCAGLGTKPAHLASKATGSAEPVGSKILKIFGRRHWDCRTEAVFWVPFLGSYFGLFKWSPSVLCKTEVRQKEARQKKPESRKTHERQKKDRRKTEEKQKKDRNNQDRSKTETTWIKREVWQQTKKGRFPCNFRGFCPFPQEPFFKCLFLMFSSFFFFIFFIFSSFLCSSSLSSYFFSLSISFLFSLSLSSLSLSLSLFLWLPPRPPKHQK